jgi:hypothetical protein
MKCVGVKSLLYADVSRSDVRVQKALEPYEGPMKHSFMGPFFGILKAMHIWLNTLNFYKLLILGGICVVPEFDLELTGNRSYSSLFQSEILSARTACLV